MRQRKLERLMKELGQDSDESDEANDDEPSENTDKFPDEAIGARQKAYMKYEGHLAESHAKKDWLQKLPPPGFTYVDEQDKYKDPNKRFNTTSASMHPKIRQAQRKDIYSNARIPTAGIPKDENAPRRLKQRVYEATHDQPNQEQADGTEHSVNRSNGDPPSEDQSCKCAFCLEPGFEDQGDMGQYGWHEPTADQACH